MVLMGDSVAPATPCATAERASAATAANAKMRSMFCEIAVRLAAINRWCCSPARSSRDQASVDLVADPPGAAPIVGLVARLVGLACAAGPLHTGELRRELCLLADLPGSVRDQRRQAPGSERPKTAWLAAVRSASLLICPSASMVSRKTSLTFRRCRRRFRLDAERLERRGRLASLPLAVHHVDAELLRAERQRLLRRPRSPRPSSSPDLRR